MTRRVTSKSLTYLKEDFQVAAKKTKKVTKLTQKDFLKLRLDNINNILGRFEKEVEGIFKKLVRQGEKSSRDLRKNFDDVIKKVRKTGIYAKAQEKTEDFEKEVRKLADDVVGRVKNLELGQGLFSAKKIFKDVRKSFNAFVHKIEKADFVEQAKEKAESTRNDILSFLSIPSQNEVERLEKKIVSLEKRIQNLANKAA